MISPMASGSPCSRTVCSCMVARICFRISAVGLGPGRADPEEALALMREGRVRGQRRRSPVLLWMLKNRETLERGFEETAPSWKGLAKYLGDHGVMDGDGKPPSAVATRQAWYRAR